MTEKKSRKVLIINNIKSDTIDQAIFILKHNPPSKSYGAVDSGIAGEAQKIIDNYIHQVERLKTDYAYTGLTKTKKAKGVLPWTLLLVVISILCVGLSVALLYAG